MENLLCYLFNHKYKTVKNYKFNCSKLQCKRCKKYFAINHNLQILLPWDKDFENLHENERFN